METSPPTTGTYRFPHWELRRDERALLVRGQRVKLGGRAFDVLLALVERQGRVVAKGELLDVAWPGLVVEENNLSVQISALRKLLGADAIVNVAGQGYQLASVPDSRGDLATAVLPATPPQLFGRDRELSALLELVGSRPLVSIVGPGGVGKTTIAKWVLASSELSWPDGNHWIDLSAVSDGVQLGRAVSRSLAIFTRDAEERHEDLSRALAPLQALIALDNCEHLLEDVVAFLAPLLRRAPGVRWLATSREPLHFVDETVYRLEPLDVPPAGVTAQQAAAFGALALFHERARSGDRTFAINDANVGVCIELCRQLDGLPLALEMAAARVTTLGLQGVREQIDQRLRLPVSTRGAPSRQHTLLQTYEWSYSLLSPKEQIVFRRLEPFAGGFTTQLAQNLCSSEVGEVEQLAGWEVLDALSALIDKSLVQRDQPGSAHARERLYLLESARDYARVKLEAGLELQDVRRRHAHVIADWFAPAEHDLKRWRDKDWADRYVPERRNVGVALPWACSADDPDLLATLVAAMARLDSFVHANAEIVRFALPMDLLARATVPLRARAHLELGWAHFLDGNRELGTDLCLRALDDFRSAGDVEGVYSALTRLIRLYIGRPGMEAMAKQIWTKLKEIDESCVSPRERLSCQSTVALLFQGGRTVERLQELNRIARRSGLDAQGAVCRLNITDELLLQGRFEEVVKTTDEMLAAGEPMLRVRAIMHHNRAHALVRLGRIEEARQSEQAMLRALPGYAHLALDLFSVVALQQGRPEDAALMVGCSTRMKRERDLDQDASEVALIMETRERLENELGPNRAADLMREGAAMPTTDALALAWVDTADG